MARRVAVVTGATHGIGREIALGLAHDDVDIVGVARSEDDLARLGKVIEDLGGHFLGVAADLSLTENVTSTAAQAWGWQERVDVLINAAGVLIRKSDVELEGADIDRTLALNVRAPMILMESLGSRMGGAGGGSIVNVTSLAGVRVTKAPAPYQASKSALIQLTRYYAVRLAPAVRVNAVSPGYIRTRLTQPWLAKPGNEEWVIEHTPLARVGTPQDVAGPVLFLVSSAAGYVTGQHLLIDGGWSTK